MSEKILKALLQLFAIIAKAERAMQAAGSERLRSRGGSRFLRQQFTAEQAAGHLAIFEAYVAAFHSSGGASQKGRKRTSAELREGAEDLHPGERGAEPAAEVRRAGPSAGVHPCRWRGGYWSRRTSS
jgi:hypothetical protein